MDPSHRTFGFNPCFGCEFLPKTYNTRHFSPCVEISVLIIAVLFLAGIIIATLGSMTGLGGGFLCVPFIVLVWGFDRPEAVAVSLFMILANSTSSSISYLRSKMVDLRVGLLLAAGAVPALFVGYYILHILAPPVFDLLFSVFLIAVISYIVVSRTRKKDDGKEKGNHPRGDDNDDKVPLKPHITLPAAFIGGMASSLFGIGGGAILMPIQVGLLKMEIKKAIATSMFVIMIVTFIRVAISTGEMEWGFAIPIALGAVLGAQIGARIVKKVKARYLLYTLAAFLISIALYMAYSAFTELL